MTTVTSLGVGSGLDLESLLTKLMTVESIPLTTLQTRQASYETKISAMGSVSSALSSLQTAASDMAADTLESASDKYATLTATVADTSIASATASTGATAGSYSLIVSQLATAAKMTSSAVSSTASLTSSATTVSLTYAGTSNSISLSAGATLSDLSDAINSADLGVTATIVTGTDGAHLVLSGETGASNTISLDTSNLSTTLTMSSTATAQDAKFSIDGIEATSSSNTVTGAIDGVTLTLSSVSASTSSTDSSTGTTTTTYTPTTLTISSSVTDKLTSALNSFISAYSSAYSTMKTLTAYDSSSETAGTLQGNGTVRMVMSQLRNLVSTTTSGTSSTYSTLANIGVTIQDDGSLELDSDKLTAALTADPTAVANLISNVGKAFNSAIDNMTGTSGSVTIATTGLESSVTDIKEQEDALQRRLDAIETRYRTQFTALDTLVSSLNSTSSYISSYLASLTSSSSS